MTVELVLGCLVALLATALAPVTPVSWRLAISLALSVPQLYVIPVGDVTFSLWFASAYLLWPEMLRELGCLARTGAFRTLMVLVGVQIVSWSWSPDIRLGAREFIYALPFFLLAAGALALGRQNPAAVAKALWSVPILMLGEAILIVVFRLSPQAKWTYLNTAAAGVFADPTAVTNLITGVETNNVLDLAKSGGVIIDANSAAAYVSIGACIAYFLHRREGRALPLSVGIALMAAVPFAGSKAGDILAVLVPAAAIMMLRRAGRDDSGSWMLRGSLIVVALFAVIELVRAYWTQILTSHFVVATIYTSATRLLIWAYAAQAFSTAPFLGQGFGGWQIGYRAYQHLGHTKAVLPPHNTLIYLWSESGLLAVLLGLAFMWLVLRLAADLMRSRDATAKSVGLVLMLVSTLVFVNGMGANSGLLGDVRQQPLFACLLGLSFAMRERRELARRVGLVLAIA